jgi:tetratricopeptide (TPR) repeat protein
MAKVTKTEEEVRQQNMAEAVSKTEEFFKKYGNLLYGCIVAVLVIALAILAYNRFILQPKKQQAMDQLVRAERWFDAGEYELALTGDSNDLGLEDIISQYGSNAPEAVYMYAGVAKLQTGAYEDAISYLKKYNGKDPIMLARAQACIGDCYVELKDYATAVDYFTKAAKTSGNALAAAYLQKAGIAAEAAGNKEQALSFYKEIKNQWGSAPEAMEIDKYINRSETAK